jgi:hypothetical protein
MGDPGRWRKWKPSGAGRAIPVKGSDGGGFVSFVSSPATGLLDAAATSSDTALSPQVTETKQTARGNFHDWCGQEVGPGGFGGFVSFVSGGTSANTQAKLRWMSWAEWKAESLNRLFRDQGVTGRPGRITAATVLHGEQKRREQLLK